VKNLGRNRVRTCKITLFLPGGNLEKIIKNKKSIFEYTPFLRAVCEKAVHFIISDEPEKEHENFDEVMIPENLSKKFYEFDLDQMGSADKEKEVTLDKAN